jgi:hypothetical protein
MAHATLTSEQAKAVLRMGQWFYPVSERYAHMTKPYFVHCDACGQTLDKDNDASIGHGEKDVCLPCALRLTKSVTGSPGHGIPVAACGGRAAHFGGVFMQSTGPAAPFTHATVDDMDDVVSSLESVAVTKAATKPPGFYGPGMR